MILIDQATKKQFNSFCKKNNPKDLETAIEYFTVFGGLNCDIDITKPLKELIQTEILDKYRYLKNQINAITGGYSVDQAVLSGIALGDRRTNSSFKRAFVSFEEGMKCIDGLVERGIIEMESSQHFLVNQRGDSKISKKLLFTTPFLRFWFAFVSPIYKGIKDGNYDEFYKNYENRKVEFTGFVFEELAMEFLRDAYKDDEIKNIGKYWDDKNSIDLVAKTKSGKTIAASCKYVNSKIKKSELNNLKNTCKEVGFEADIYILFTKKGFTNELKALKDETLRLYTAKSFKLLLDK
ncbi:MAG: hypothetical protein CL623_07765 [Arcobacter sp.]|nr:hypothetical protein [Arcobacter sp.]